MHRRNFLAVVAAACCAPLAGIRTRSRNRRAGRQARRVAAGQPMTTSNWSFTYKRDA